MVCYNYIPGLCIYNKYMFSVFCVCIHGRMERSDYLLYFTYFPCITGLLDCLKIELRLVNRVMASLMLLKGKKMVFVCPNYTFELVI